MRKNCLLLLLLIVAAFAFSPSRKVIRTDVLIIGGGASGTMAGIQSARMKVKTLIVEETEWLGGMLTAAGVSAIDGNHRLPAGLWGEFRNELYKYYGGPKAVETGWVSNTLFEPSVGNKLLQGLAAKEKNYLTIWFQSRWKSIRQLPDGSFMAEIIRNGKEETVQAKRVIDATELGDVMAALGVKYSVGMDSRYESGEPEAPEEANDIVQDLTYVITLKDYGPDADMTIPQPEGYDPSEFTCCCDISDPASYDSPNNNCFQMLQYGRLPNNKYMINWPKCGNDVYMNIIELSREERVKKLEEAKLHTLRFIYYIQKELGYKNLGIAKDEYPTKDGFPMIPYHRESRRMEGLVRFSLPYVSNPYDQEKPLYRTGVIVGDYTIDHHHLKNPSAPPIDFVKIRVPSYNVPMGTLIPKGVEGLIVAEKSISVTNIVNGATRLQPVVMQIGQAAGILAALSVQQDKKPSELEVRDVQKEVLNAKGYLMPFIDVDPSDKDFEAIQRIGATGILKGYGVPYKWANQTWFYPELPVSEYEFVSGLRPYYESLKHYWGASGELLTAEGLTEIFKLTGKDIRLEEIVSFFREKQLSTVKTGTRDALTRRAVALLTDYFLNPFDRHVDIEGNLKSVTE